MSLRSKCGSERKPPEPSKQRWPGPTPQVGQVTEDNCSGVKSRILIPQSCEIQIRKTVRFDTESRLSLKTSDFDSWQLVQDLALFDRLVLRVRERTLDIEPVAAEGGPIANRQIGLAFRSHGHRRNKCAIRRGSLLSSKRHTSGRNCAEGDAGKSREFAVERTM